MPEIAGWNNRQLVKVSGRVVGAVFNGEFVKRVIGSKHKLRNRPGWAVDLAALSVARTLGATAVRIEDTESGRVFLVDLATLEAHGYNFNRGWGEQIALDLKHWQLQGAPTAAEALPVQAALFA